MRTSALSRRAQLALRRRELAIRSTLLRSEASAHAAELQPLFGVADRVQDGWSWLRERPPAMVLPVAAVALVWVWRRPSRLLTLPWRAWAAWRLWQRVAARWA